MAEAKPAEGENPSMEEILQSIRRIIADDGDEAKPNEAGVAGSDVLELTELVEEDGTPAAAQTPAAINEVVPGDILSTIDQALAADKPAAAPAAPIAPEPPKPAAAPAPVEPPKAAAPAVPPPAPVAVPAAAPITDSLLSQAAASAAAASFNKLKIEEELPPVMTTPSPAFRSGKTVEDMVAEMLRPMIKEWLDTNLPTIVERIVQVEVKRLTK